MVLFKTTARSRVGAFKVSAASLEFQEGSFSRQKKNFPGKPQAGMDAHPSLSWANKLLWTSENSISAKELLALLS